ncbi:MAG: ABC transporter ATP-binding protein [Thermoleophilaceae bacterium]
MTVTTPALDTALAACDRVTVAYGAGDARVVALHEVTTAIEPADRVALTGPSGSGKTTVLHVLGGLVTPTSGSAMWKGEPLSSLDAAARGRARAQGIAYVFQAANLLPYFTARENVAFAARSARRAGRDPRDPAELLALVGLAKKGDSLPSELSGGEQQRVAIARALGQRPELLLCDEPTGHLDSDTGVRVLDLIDALQEELGFALVLATHDPDVAARGRRLMTLLDGRIMNEETL